MSTLGRLNIFVKIPGGWLYLKRKLSVAGRYVRIALL